MRGLLRLTWFELGVVVVTLGIGATVAGADLASRRRERRIKENEASAVATLRLIAEAQEQFKALTAADVDWDGVGEYGTFRELAGSIAVRTSWDGTNTGGSVLSNPLLPSEFSALRGRAVARRQGYRFKVFLPGSVGSAVEETASYSTFDTLAGSVADDLPSMYWCAYAWPARRGRSGRRAFFINQASVVTSTSDRVCERWPWGMRCIDTDTAGAAFVLSASGSAGTITGTQALGTVGRDGNFWRVVE